MRKFNVTVNGKSFEVEVEETGAPTAMTAIPVAHAAPGLSVAQPAPAAAAPATAVPAPKAVPTPKPAGGSAGAVKMNAPMPGTILKVLVEPGQAVKKGTVLLILEAMKMENEIMAAQDGIVATVDVVKNQQVNSGDLMISMS